MELLNATVKKIKSLDEEAILNATKRMDSLIKPIGSLGRLEELAIKMAGITGKVKNSINKKCVVVMAADNGICEEGVTTSPQIITAMQAVNMTKGFTGISVLCKHAGSDLKVIDIGIKHDYSCNDIVNKKIRNGTWNFLKGPAMTDEEAVKGIEIGIEITQDLIAQGYDIIGTGEMGIGNTSSSSAVLMGLTGCGVSDAVGKGAGLTEEAFAKKKYIINAAVEYNHPDSNNPIDVLAKVGGFDIAGLVGCFLACAANRVPVVIDGFISAAAALIAWKINPLSKDYMITSHCSAEPGYSIVVKEMGLKPVLDLEMRLGEGTGCPLMFNIVESALCIMNQMATFDDMEMESEHLIDIRAEEEK